MCLASIILVNKPHGKWRMCSEYTNLNKVCYKDFFPLPRIDQLVDFTSSHALLNFMVAFLGYIQVSVEPSNEAHKSFITTFDTYCYKVMPFGLKNVGVTY